MDNSFYDRMKMLLGDDYQDFINSLNKPPIKAFYLNNKPNIIDHLNENLITKHPYIKDGFYYDNLNYQLGKHPFFNCGLYYIQEPSAMVVSEIIDFKKDDKVLDMCGAPGGKSCHIATKLSNDGLLITNDINPLRAKILSENIERFALTNTIVTNTDPLNFTKLFSNYFDKIIIDAPCSGEGMLRTTKDAKDTWSIEKINECSIIQEKLLDSAIKMLKPGGYIIYSTCTYSLEENEYQITKALTKYPLKLIDIKKQIGMVPGYNLPQTVRLYPHTNKGEGQFIACMQKNTNEETNYPDTIKPTASKQQIKLLEEFYHTNLNITPPKYIYSSNNHLYAINPHFPELKGIKILRNGLYLGECKKNRFEPSLSLALTLSISEVKRYYNFSQDDPLIKQYINGQSLIANNEKGYGIIFVEGYPLSFYKENNGQVKNLYPKGLRR